MKTEIYQKASKQLSEAIKNEFESNTMHSIEGRIALSQKMLELYEGLGGSKEDFEIVENICARCVRAIVITPELVLCMDGNPEDVDVLPFASGLPRCEMTHSCDSYQIDYARCHSLENDQKEQNET